MYFYNFFSVILMFSAVMTVVAPNPIQSVFWLVLSFLAGSALLISLRLDFIPLVLIIVYVGAIVILFLFVVMMLEVNQQNKSPVYNVIPIMLVFSVLGTEGIFIRSKIKIFGQSISYEGMTFNYDDHLHIIGEILYTNYIFPFIILTILLLIGLVGAIMLGLEASDRRKQELSTQQRRNNSWI
uniref:NADH dehydrogenase subunit 6 n=1 Tax=Agalma clausi TaxID=316165 RepID=UPI0026E215CA|nr:NADH dehydrogenase subunit 6 [Agalma clausi]WJJ70153.1 NADH dehydrogenase subunit 6 [Agalma clausi]